MEEPTKEQLNIFDYLYKDYEITKPIRLIELFAGVGSQAMALRNLGVEFEHYKICEWAIPSIIAYDLVHTNDGKDYSSHMSGEELKDYLYKRGISNNYNDPMTETQVKRLPEKQLRKIYNAIHRTNNLVNIMETKGGDLEIVETDKYEYIMTYSFPCQDLSLAGKQAGMGRDSGTRSGMLWEVERLLKETKELPQILLMENVPQVIGTNNIGDFQKWQYFLEKMGYSNFVETLNSKDYGMPQNRNRTFMVSLLGQKQYKFPKPIKLNLKLKDILEKDVDEKYYLSDKQIKRITESTFTQAAKRIHESDGIMSTLLARDYKDPKCVVLPEATKKGYCEAYEGDGVYINRPHQKRGVIQEQMIQTLKTSVDDLGVVVKEPTLRIRKLTPKECWRLMGFLDSDFDKVDSELSNSRLYHIAGDSIVTWVLMAIFSTLLGLDYKKEIRKLLKEERK